MRINELTLELWKLGYTNADIAKRFGVTPEFVSMVLNNRRNSARAIQIRAFVEELIQQRKRL